MSTIDPRLQDHIVGVEQQIIEVVSQVEHTGEQTQDRSRLLAELNQLYLELAATAERLTVAEDQSAPSLRAS